MMNGLKVKGFLIDFGDTLAYTDGKAYDMYIEEIVAVVRENRGSLDADNVRSTFTSLYRSSSLGEMKSLEDFWTIFLGRLGVSCEKGLIDRLERIRKRFYVSSFKLYEGVPSVLSVLLKKYRLALVSNCCIGLMDVITALGLTEFFEVIVLSYEVGVRKPDERIYVEALKRMELKGDECVFVADEISDLEGARRLGMRTLLVRQGVSTLCEVEDLGFKPDFEVERVAQIVDFL
jgi:FMN phosphatase YigB (HAD superfamily)